MRSILLRVSGYSVHYGCQFGPHFCGYVVHFFLRSITEHGAFGWIPRERVSTISFHHHINDRCHQQTNSDGDEKDPCDFSKKFHPAAFVSLGLPSISPAGRVNHNTAIYNPKSQAGADIGSYLTLAVARWR